MLFLRLDVYPPNKIGTLDNRMKEKIDRRMFLVSSDFIEPHGSQRKEETMNRTILTLISLAMVATTGCFAHSEETPNGTSSGVNVLGVAGFNKKSSKKEYDECIKNAPENSPDLRPWIDMCRQYTTAGAPGAQRPMAMGALAYDPLLMMGGYGYGMNPYLIPAPLGRHELAGSMFDPVQASYALDRQVVSKKVGEQPAPSPASKDSKLYKQVEAGRKDLELLGEDLGELQGRVEKLEEDKK